MMDSTAKRLYQLCLKRAVLLRRALEALVSTNPSAHWCTWAMDSVDRELKDFKALCEWKEKQKDGRNNG